MLCNGLRTGFMDYGIYGLWFEHIELCYNYIVWCFIMVNHAEFIIILPNLNIEMLHLVKRYQYIIRIVFHYIDRNRLDIFNRLTLVYMTHNNTLHDLHRLNQHHQAKISNILIILRRNNQQQLLLAYLIVSFSLDLFLIVMSLIIWNCILFVDVYTTMVHWYALIILMFRIIILCLKSNIMILLAIVQYNCRIISTMTALQYDSKGVGQFILCDTKNFVTFNSFKQTSEEENITHTVLTSAKCFTIHIKIGTCNICNQNFLFRNTTELFSIIILVIKFFHQSVYRTTQLYQMCVAQYIVKPFTYEYVAMYVTYMYVKHLFTFVISKSISNCCMVTLNLQVIYMLFTSAQKCNRKSVKCTIIKKSNYYIAVYMYTLEVTRASTNILCVMTRLRSAGYKSKHVCFSKLHINYIILPICVTEILKTNLYMYGIMIQLLQQICNNCKPGLGNKFIHNGGD